MSKKKSNKNGKKDTITNIVMGGSFIAILLMATYLMISANDSPETGMVTWNPTGGIETVPITGAGLEEKGPIMSPEYFSGRTKQIYQWATEIPEALDVQYCYCRCADNPKFKHKTLLTCFVDTHAANCKTCLDQGEMAWQLTQEGLTPQEIRKRVDEYYAKLERQRRS